MPSLKPWPVLILRLEDGPDDGEERLVPAAVSVVPSERVKASVHAAGWQVRHPELPAPWTWRYLWTEEGRSQRP